MPSTSKYRPLFPALRGISLSKQPPYRRHLLKQSAQADHTVKENGGWMLAAPDKAISKLKSISSLSNAAELAGLALFGTGQFPISLVHQPPS
ncbi:hypothetical protein [Rhizobium sp. S163]|uniref:hypothetical protein n=1 Tax=Rhizobium sp. S163 TaxID=3055039 RepID=UPI0013AEFCD5|nr:hypothetical protein [Rhizobium sp. S163]MDM9646170.1 hypothetical protein [Rhizobium sp. S163]